MKDSERMKIFRILFIRHCMLFVVWGLLFIFLFAAPAHAYWIQYDWSGGDSQFFWYDTTSYDTDLSMTIVDDPPAEGGHTWNDTAVVIEGGEYTGVLLSSTYGADSPVVWKTIEWNFPSTSTNPYNRGDSRLRKDEATGLVALWHFDEGFDVSGASANDSTVYDESINNNSGIVHGCVWGKWTTPSSPANAVFGSALNFDASNGDSVVFGAVSSNVRTIEFWMNSDGTDSGILQLNESSSADTVYISDTDEIKTSFTPTTTIYVNGSESASVSAGSWYHIAIITDGSIDASALTLGKTDAGYFSGTIDEVAIYDREKTVEEIWQDARGAQIRLRTQTTSSILDGIGKADSAIGLWHFDNLEDKPTSEIAYDSSVYKHHGTTFKAPGEPVWYQWGVFGKCLQFDGSDDYVSWSSNIGNVKSIEFWMNPDGNDSAILQLNENPSADTVYISDDDKLEVSFGDTIIYVNGNKSSTKISAGSWYHVAITKSGDPITVDKLKVGEVGSGHFSGLIDELGLYNYERSERQVKIDARGGQPWSPWSPYYKDADIDDIVLFADDFNDGLIDSSWGQSGTWYEGDDTTTHDSGIITCTGNGYNIANNSDWYDEQITVKIKIKSGEAGIVYRWLPAGGGYAAFLDSSANEVHICAVDASGIKTGSLAFKAFTVANTWYTLRVTSDGTNDRVYVDDEFYIRYKHSTTDKGKAGLYNSGGEAIFNDFKVHPIDRYIRYEATLTDNVCNDTTPYLYWVRLDYESTDPDKDLWSKIWQDRYGLHINKLSEEVTWAPQDEDSTTIWSVLNCADIDLADTTWCYNLENYDDNENHHPPTSPDTPDGGLMVFVEVPVSADCVNLRLGYRKTTALTTPGTWPDNIDDYEWNAGDGWIPFNPNPPNAHCSVEYDAAPAGDTQIWKCTFTETQINDNFSKEAGYIMQSQAVSSGDETELSPTSFEPIYLAAEDCYDRADTSIIYMMKDITPPGSTNASGGWPWQIGESGYQPSVTDRDNDNWIFDTLQIKGVQSSDHPNGTEGWYKNSPNTWINYNSQDDSGILVSVEDKNPDPNTDRENDCSGLKEKAFDDSPTRYIYSIAACPGREWRNPDRPSLVINTTTNMDIGDWAECDTGWDAGNEIRYLALGTGFDNPMPDLGTRSSKEGRDILIQFAQKDKAGNWGYSHPDYSEYQADDSPGYYINYDITKPVPRIISAPRESNPSKYASFKFDDDSVDDSSLFCAFNARLEINNDTDKTKGNYSVVSGYDFRPPPPDSSWLGGWTPTSDNASTTFPIDYSPYWYRCSVKAKDEALNESDDYDTYYFQCMPVPNTIIYSGPSGIITSSSGSYNATFKFEGEGGSETPYKFAYSIDGSDWDDSLGTTTTKEISSLGYGNHVFRVRARNNSAADGDAGTDKTPASVAFTIVNPAQLPTIAPPSNPVKYWRQESE